MNLQNYLSVSEEVKDAVAKGLPVVALESTIISHGMPYPKNVETALEVERVVRDNGAIPATIAIIKGKFCVGINKEQIEYLGKKGLDVIKASRRDVPVLLAKGEDGATTVTTTMMAAKLAGIKIFATGGLGGVHRGAEKTMDISADLEELSQTDVYVVCAGVKAILDLKLTLEYLETKGVTVLGYQTDELPAFYSKTSGLKVDYRVDTPKEIADIIQVKDVCGIKGGMLITNPIPDEYSLDGNAIEVIIESAIKKADNLGIKGKAITPYLLDEVQKQTGGESLESNIKLVINNAKLGAEIAIELSKIKKAVKP
ncbi:MAG: pseudouridine-5'-phosphate glycosidase [Christensenellaceae bacterium]|nr:pseudouridine-5'-phosphate glycosidase [Christensenellaceae bacterium]